MAAGSRHAGRRDALLAWTCCVVPRLAIVAAFWPNVTLDTPSATFAGAEQFADWATPLWPPAYAAFAAVMWWVSAGHPVIYVLGHVAVHALVGVFALSLCRSLALGPRVAWWAVVAVAILPYYVSTALRQLDVGVVIVVCAAFVAVIARWRQLGSTGIMSAAGVGVMAMALVLTRANAFSLVLALYALVWYRPGTLRRRAVMVSIVVWVALLATWSVANQMRFGALTPFPSNVGLNLWDGNHPGVSAVIGRRDFNPSMVAAPKADHVDPSIYGADGELARAAKDYIRTHPGEFLRNIVTKCIRYWDWRLDDLSPHTRWQALAYSASVVVSWVLAGVGVFVLARRNRWALAMLAAVVIGYMAPHLIAYGMIRHRMSVEWAVLMLSAVGADALARRASPAYSLHRDGGRLKRDD